MKIRSLVTLATIASLPLAAISCSLFTSLDGLQGGTSADAAIDSSSIDDAATNETSAVTDAAPDASTGLLSCNANGLVAFWPFDEGTGVDTHDCHQGLQGVFSSSGVSWGKRGTDSALVFSGGAGYVTLGTVAALQLPGPFTIAGWFRLDGNPTNYASLFWNYDGETLAGFEITTSPEGLTYAQAGFGGQNTQAYFSSLPVGVWVHLAATFTPGVELRIFLNGASVGVATTLASDGGSLAGLSVAPDDHDARFGADDPDSTWTGGVDDVRVFSRVLTDLELQTLASQ
jgi:hypothetical protein